MKANLILLIQILLKDLHQVPQILKTTKDNYDKRYAIALCIKKFLSYALINLLFHFCSTLDFLSLIISSDKSSIHYKPSKNGRIKYQNISIL